MESTPDLYGEFKLYRAAAISKDSSVYEYFSSKILGAWLDPIILRDEVPTFRIAELTRNQVLFGEKIEVVHSYEVLDLNDGTYQLDLYYSGPREEGLRRIGLVYRKVVDRYVIDGFDYYLYDFGEIPDTQIDDFGPVSE